MDLRCEVKVKGRWVRASHDRRLRTLLSSLAPLPEIKKLSDMKYNSGGGGGEPKLNNIYIFSLGRMGAEVEVEFGY